MGSVEGEFPYALSGVRYVRREGGGYGVIGVVLHMQERFINKEVRLGGEIDYYCGFFGV